MPNIIPWRRKRNADEMHPAEASLVRLRREMDTLFDRFFRDPWGGLDALSEALPAAPRLDLAETDERVTVTLDLPGVDPKDVDISVTGGMLTVRGERKHEREDKRADYHFVERQFGAFQRSVQLPSTVDPDKVEAKFKNGVLTIEVAKHPDAKPKRIKVREA